MRWLLWALSVLGIFGLVVFWASLPQSSGSTWPLALVEKLAAVNRIRPADLVSCDSVKSKRPLVVLALGQSNAGNHGELANNARESVVVISGAQCAVASSPLPGGTGSGGNVWAYLPSSMREAAALERAMAISVLAVDATSITDWTAPGSPLRARLVQQLQQLEMLGLSPDAILWQQGEADARLGTSKDQYIGHLRTLREIVGSTGSIAPIFLARATICRSSESQALRSAISEVLGSDPGFTAGADTDTLIGADNRIDGCHFSTRGQVAAARLWAASIRSGLNL